MSLPRISWHIGDYLKDTGHLRAAGHGAYFMLCLHYYANGGLPDDDSQLAAIARMSDAEWRKYKPVIQAFFQDGWKHKRIEKEIKDANEKYEKRASAGSKGGKAKAEAKQTPSNATAKPKQPITDNQTSVEQRGSTEGRGTRLPADWWPSDANVQYAVSKGFSLNKISTEAEKFRNHWTAKTGKDATKLDWEATWQNWILKSLEFNGHGTARKQNLVERGHALADEARRLEFAAGLGGPDDAVGSD